MHARDSSTFMIKDEGFMWDLGIYVSTSYFFGTSGTSHSHNTDENYSYKISVTELIRRYQNNQFLILVKVMC